MKINSLTQKIVFGKLLAFLIIPGSLIGSARSNIEVIDSLLVGYFTEAVVSKISGTDSVAIRYNTNDIIIQNYIYRILGNLLSGDSITVFRNYNSRIAFEGIVVEINKVIPEVKYSAPFNETPVSAAMIRRTISIQITGQLYKTQNGQILNSLEKYIKYGDEFPADKVKELDNSAYKFTIGKRVFSSPWDTYFEPILLVSTVGIIIYLFFSQRF